MHNIPTRIDSKFRYVLLASQRAEQIMRGARPKVERQGKVARTAMDEITQSLVEWDYGPAPVPEPDESIEAGEEDAEEDVN